MKHPLEALHNIIMYLGASSRLHTEPGHFIKRASAEDKEALSRLTSTMTQSERPWWTDEWLIEYLWNKKKYPRLYKRYEEARPIR